MTKILLLLLGIGLILAVSAAEEEEISPLSGDESEEVSDEENENEEDSDEDEERDEDGLNRNQLTSSAFQKLWDNYPRWNRSTLYATKIGGEMAAYANDPKWANTCTVRLSYALNRAGVRLLKLPKAGGWSWKPGKWRRRPWNTKKASDGKFYAFRVREIAPFLLDRMNWPSVTWTNPDAPRRGGTTIPEAFKGKKGVVMFDVKIWNDASGHVDLWDGSKCKNHCYFSESQNVYLWEPRG